MRLLDFGEAREETRREDKYNGVQSEMPVGVSWEKFSLLIV